MFSCMAWPPPTSSSTMKPCALFCVFALLLLMLLSLPHSAHADITDDADALLALKESVGGDLESWNASDVAGICTSWKGITCSNVSPQRVIQLRLPGSALLGSIPLQTLGNLDALQVVSLRKNRLSGSLPPDLSNCAQLQQLILNNNSLSGSLPQNLSAWPLLKKLDLSSNSFSGQIPSSLSDLINLDTFFVQNNGLSGSIPALGASLQSFSVANNLLNGSIPSSLSRFSTESFAGNPALCGAPLAECTEMPAPPSIAPPPPPPPPPPPTPDNDGNNKKLSAGAIAGIVVGSAVLFAALMFCVLFLLCTHKKRKQGDVESPYAEGRADVESKHREGSRGRVIYKKGSGRSGERGGGSVHSNSLMFMGNAKQTFDLDDLLRASAEVLGKGSLGTSYKALMNDGKPFCVKRFREVATEREETCKHIETLGALQHPNLVPLRAYFFAPKGKLIVSDYMPTGNLTSLLHGNDGVPKEPLHWEVRLAIAGDAAKGVVFLHSRKIVHGNIKANNVLMDSDNQARLSDYSLVHLLPRDPTISNLQPTAYTSPEARGDLRKVTYKGDVYAFGVLLLELVTGLSPSKDSNADELVQWVQAHYPQNVEGVLDPRLIADSDDNVQDEMISLLHIALPCVSVQPEKRPHMVEVVSSIENLRKHDNHPEATDFYFTQAE